MSSWLIPWLGALPLRWIVSSLLAAGLFGAGYRQGQQGVQQAWDAERLQQQSAALQQSLQVAQAKPGKNRSINASPPTMTPAKPNFSACGYPQRLPPFQQLFRLIRPIRTLCLLICALTLTACATQPAPAIPAPCPPMPSLPPVLMQPPPTLYLIPPSLRSP